MKACDRCNGTGKVPHRCQLCEKREDPLLLEACDCVRSLPLARYQGDTSKEAYGMLTRLGLLGMG